MAVVDTPDKFREAVSYLQSQSYFGSTVLSLVIGDSVQSCAVLNDATQADITPDTPTLEAALDNANTANASLVEQESFVEAMQPIIRAWHKGTQNTATALSNAQDVLDSHPAHKSVMNSQIWPATRLIVNPLANVTLGNISGNPTAEAAYLLALFEYTTRVKTWRG